MDNKWVPVNPPSLEELEKLVQPYSYAPEPITSASNTATVEPPSTPQWGWDPPTRSYDRISLNRLRHRTERLANPLPTPQARPLPPPVQLNYDPDAVKRLAESLTKSISEGLKQAMDALSKFFDQL